MTTGAKIQQLRKSSGMSQEELASKITVSRQAISKWELDESLPDTDNIVQLSRIFNVTADFLLNDYIDSEQNLPIVQNTVKNMKKCAKKKINHIKLAALIVLLIVVIVLGVVAGIEMSIMLLMGALSLIVTVYVVYLAIKFLWRNTR